MRGIFSLAGLLVVALIAALIYKFYLQPQSTGAGAATSTPVQTIDSIGAQNDLISIGQAERVYQAEHAKYASLDELVSSGALAIKKQRQGYEFDSQASDDGFRITARCVAQVQGCVSYTIDQNMSVQAAP